MVQVHNVKNQVMQAVHKEGGHSYPWEGERKWSLVWAHRNEAQENCSFQGWDHPIYGKTVFQF
jgi:hypothetical protein